MVQSLKSVTEKIEKCPLSGINGFKQTPLCMGHFWPFCFVSGSLSKIYITCLIVWVGSLLVLRIGDSKWPVDV